QARGGAVLSAAEPHCHGNGDAGGKCGKLRAACGQCKSGRSRTREAAWRTRDAGAADRGAESTQGIHAGRRVRRGNGKAAAAARAAGTPDPRTGEELMRSLLLAGLLVFGATACAAQAQDGDAAYRAGRYQEAISFFERRVQSGGADAMRALARVYLEIG